MELVFGDLGGVQIQNTVAAHTLPHYFFTVRSSVVSVFIYLTIKRSVKKQNHSYPVTNCIVLICTNVSVTSDPLACLDNWWSFLWWLSAVCLCGGTYCISGRCVIKGSQPATGHVSIITNLSCINKNWHFNRKQGSSFCFIAGGLTLTFAISNPLLYKGLSSFIVVYPLKLKLSVWLVFSKPYE